MALKGFKKSSKIYEENEHCLLKQHEEMQCPESVVRSGVGARVVLV